MIPVVSEGVVVAVARDPGHRFSKAAEASIRLLAGLGVEGDAHCGATVQHRSRVAQDPTQPNLRQVHLLAAEFLDEAAQAGFAMAAGQMGENLTLRGLDLLALPRGAVLRLGGEAEVEVTGLRNPCAQIEAFRPGLLALTLRRTAEGGLIRRAGIMGIVRRGGTVRPGDRVIVTLPPGPQLPLDRV